MKHGKIEEARQLLQRSLLSLEKRKRRVIVIKCFGTLIVVKISKRSQSLLRWSINLGTLSGDEQYLKALSIPIESALTCGTSTLIWKPAN